MPNHPESGSDVKGSGNCSCKSCNKKTSLPKSEQKEEKKKSEDEGKDLDTVTPEASNGEGNIAPASRIENADDDPDLVGNMNNDDIKAAQAIEREMKAQDSILAEIGDARNALESYIYEMRVCNGNGGNDLYKLLDTDKLLPLLTTAEDWMYESDDYTKDDYTNKLSELTKTFNETSPNILKLLKKSA